MKAQGLPITTIIIAGLGLLVLVVLGVMLAQKSGQFGKGTREVSEQECKAPVGTPMPIDQCDNPVYGSFKGLRPDQICCKLPAKR